MALATNWLLDTYIHTYIYTEEKDRDWTIKQPTDIPEGLRLSALCYSKAKCYGNEYLKRGYGSEENMKRRKILKEEDN